MFPTPDGPRLGVRDPGPDLELDHLLLLGEEVGAREDLGGLLVIVPEELAPHGGDLAGNVSRPRPQRHMSVSWIPWLPTSPLP